jgi:multiple sugar transport system permease protein
LGDLEGGFRERFRLQAEVTQAFLDNPIDVRQTEPTVTGSGVNVLTSFDFTLENFQRVFDSSEFWFVLRVTIYYTVFSTAGALVVGLFAAQLMNTAFKGRGILRGLFLFPYVAPVIAVAFTWLILLDPFSGTINAMLVEMGLIGAPINFFGTREVDVTIFGFTFGFPVALSTVIAFEAWRYFPLSFLFILAAMQSVSAEMYEAAEMDGATPLQQFWYLSLPQLVGILSVLFLLRFIWTFNKFDDIFLLTGGAAGTRTLTVQVYEQGFALSNLGAGAAVAVVVFFVLLVFALAFFKFSPKEGGA